MFVKLGRILMGYGFVFPWTVAVYVLIPFYGRPQALQRVGKVLTRFAAWITGKLLPQIATPDQFGEFKGRAERMFRLLAPLYDLEIRPTNPDTLGIQVRHCCVTATFRRLGLPEMCKYVCASDWMLAKKNAAMWDFSREHSLGTDGQYCNQTYHRKICRG
jgi:hypothetical protein